ncbi:putative vomeronasal receptor-like protein 4 [Fukomys damarensis]|uniref:putative vomeronasal receptor-like protein 4 n=1 Tax=Fukomys damarensis TaxID=885580 RepID=UPI0014553376|nr:putative vomeronasal receptor-like protein 4 [Fukomys damarensis]
MVYKLANCTICVFLAGLSIVGNIFVFLNNTYNVRRGAKSKSIHFIIIHLAFTNIIMIVSKGVPKIIPTFGVRNFLDDTDCKIVAYVERVARGLSICTSALLTVVQAATICPRHSRWRRLKPRTVWHILLLLLFFWVLNSLIGMNLLHCMKSTSMNISQFSKCDYCHLQPQNQKIRSLFVTLMVVRDAVFQSVMGGASGYMAFLPHKHHQSVLHLQGCKLLYKTPPEIKAVQSVLLLMLGFLFFYWIDCVLALCISFENHSMVINI